MKKIYTSILTMSALLFAGVADAQMSDTTYVYTGSLQTFVVPAGATSIQIEANGAQGGSYSGALQGGLGAYISGTFDVTPGQILDILVGQQGYTGTGSACGGGGGSFVVDQATTTPLVVAGGGSGATSVVAGNPGLAIEDGDAGDGCAGNGGTLGNGGGDAAACGNGTGGGGGFYTDGASTSYWGSQRGFAYVNGGAGGTSSYGSAHGGYGGGGGTHASNTGGGPGGGYSGGGAPNHGSSWAGGGGGSFNSGTDQTNTEGVNAGNGTVIITVLCNALTTTVSADTICQYDEVILHAESTIGGIVTWDGGITDSVAFTIDSAGVTAYTATSDTTGDCPFTVEIFVEPAPEFVLNSTDELIGGDGTAGITLTDGVFPFSYDWDNDGTGDFDDDQNQTGLSGGWYTVTVKHGNGCTSTDSVQVNSQLWIKELGENVNLYPNPTSDYITIEGMNNFTYSIVDAQGKVVLFGEGGEKENISLSELERGVYMIKLTYLGVSQTVQLVKE